MIDRRKIGSQGEKIAADFLINKGYKILDQNYFTKFGEIDLIATKDNVLVFVEVKLKQTDDFGTPEEMISQKKLLQVERMAKLYLLDEPEISKKYESFRIDAVCIVTNYDGQIERISHYESPGF